MDRQTDRCRRSAGHPAGGAGGCRADGVRRHHYRPASAGGGPGGAPPSLLHRPCLTCLTLAGPWGEAGGQERACEVVTVHPRAPSLLGLMERRKPAPLYDLGSWDSPAR